MQELQKTIDLVIEYIRGIWIKKRYIMLSTWLICPVGFIYIASLPDQFEAETRVFVDTRSALQPLLVGLAIQTRPEQELAIITRTFKSRPNLEKLARETDLDIEATSDSQYEGLINRLRNGINFESNRSNIYTISFADKNPQVAYRVVREALDLFVETTLGESRQDTDTASKFLDEQIAEYESRLSTAETKLANFKRENLDLLPGSTGSHSRLQGLKENERQLGIQIKELESQIDALKSRLQVFAQSQQGDLSGQEGISTPYDSRIESLEKQLDQLRLRYTDLHPEIIETKALLESLKANRSEQIQKYLDEAKNTGNTATNTPLLSDLNLEISRLEGQKASLEVRKADATQQISELEAKIDQVPLIEAQLTALNRDYGITKSKYEQLLGRREAASITKSADISADDVNFKIIDPPKLPMKPNGPKRILMYSGVLVLSIFVGLGIAFIVSQLNPYLVNSTQLVKWTDIPILGTVQNIHIAEINKKRRTKLLFFIGSCSAVLLIYMGFIGAEMKGIHIIDRLQEYL